MPKPLADAFSRAAHWTSGQCGRAHTFIAASLIVVTWALTGPVFHYSDTWQLVINTGTTIVTFLMVFLIQNTQNRDTVAIHLKLDELIRVSRHARNKMLQLEDMTEDELRTLKEAFSALAPLTPATDGRGAEPAPAADPSQAVTAETGTPATSTPQTGTSETVSTAAAGR